MGPKQHADPADLPRLFVALWPSDTARESLAAGLNPAHDSSATSVRWQPAARWHITVAFLGRTDPERVTSRLDWLMTRPDVPRPTPIRLSGVGTFGPVIWIGVEHERWLSELADRVQRTVRSEEHRFRAHVTVGRVRGPDAARRAKEAAGHQPTHVGPAWTPDEITLVASRTGPQPQYEVLAAWPLASPNVKPATPP